MKPFSATPQFLKAAKRIVWFKPPEETLARPIELMAYAMKHSLDEDMALLLDHVGLDGLREAIECAPPGIIGARSWAYWNARAGFVPARPQPTRNLDT